MNWKNRLFALLVGMIRFFSVKNQPSHRFLIVSTTALGDSLWATPAIESLRSSFPEAYIVLLTSSIGEQALRHNPWCNKTYVLQKHSLFALWKRLKKERIDTVLLFHASQRKVLPLCATIGASKIIGTSQINKGLDFLLTDLIDNQKKHEIVRRLEIVEQAGAKRCTEQLSYFLQPHEKNGMYPEKWIALHPGSKDRFKRWPISHFAAVGKKLQEKGYQILITGSGDEKELMEQLHRQIPGSKMSDPHSSLRAFAALITEMELLISNDSGPVHLAAALNVPVIALYSATDPALCGTHQAPLAKIIGAPPTCSPCLKKQCLRPFCLLQIGIEEVIKNGTQLLNLG